METVMSNKTRSAAGKFVSKSETPRKIRSVNLTDDAWQWLASVAEKAGMSRNDYIEGLAEGNNPLMETVELQVCPLMETAELQVCPLMETAQIEIESLKQQLRSLNRQLAEQEKELLQLHERNGDLGLEVQNLKEELATVTRDRTEIKNLALAVADFPEAADILNQLKARRKKSKTDLTDLEVILEILEG